MRAVLPLLAAALLGIVAPCAQAETITPPGNAGVQQYGESVPTPGGGKLVRDVGKAGATPLAQRTVRALRASGADGQALAGLVAATSPLPARPKHGGAKGTGGRHPQSAASSTAPASEPVIGTRPSASHAILDGLGGGSGGAILLVLMLVCVAGGAATAIARRRLARR